SGPAWSDLCDQIQNAQHALTLADDVRETIALLERALELRVFALQARPRDHALDLDQQLLVIPGLREVVVRSAFERVYRHLDRAVRSDHEDGRLGIALAHVAQYLHAGAIRHHQIQQDQIVVPSFDLVLALGRVRGEVDLIVLERQQRFQTFPDVCFVIDYQDAAFGLGLSGKVGRELFRHAPVFWPTATLR